MHALLSAAAAAVAAAALLLRTVPVFFNKHPLNYPKLTESLYQ